jgi:hypothetical protein
MEDGMAVIDRANPRAVLQQSIEGYNEAARRADVLGAAAELRNLYHDTTRLHTPEFRAQWNAVSSQGDLMGQLYARPPNLTWRQLDQAKEAVVHLLTECNMWFQRDAEDTLESRERRLMDAFHKAGWPGTIGPVIDVDLDEVLDDQADDGRDGAPAPTPLQRGGGDVAGATAGLLHPRLHARGPAVVVQ